MKRKKSVLLIVPVILAGGIFIYAWVNRIRPQSTEYRQINTPTLFFHGAGSSYHAEEYMVKAAVKAGVTKEVIQAFVDRKGKVALRGTLSKQAVNPIIEVNYADNMARDFYNYGHYATNVVKKLMTQYHFEQLNLVGHSAGNISTIYYELLNGKNSAMPKIAKQVNIAGHFAGLSFKHVPDAIKLPPGMKLKRNGQPNKMNESYQEMTKVRQLYHKDQLKVLNIVGDIGNQTDGTVPNISSLSLKYLVTPGASSYQVLTIKGRQAQHSKLHHNQQVNQALIKFLWQ